MRFVVILGIGDRFGFWSFCWGNRFDEVFIDLFLIVGNLGLKICDLVLLGNGFFVFFFLVRIKVLVFVY